MSCVQVFHKTGNRAPTAKKCSKTCDARAKQKQKRVVKITSKSTFDAHSDPIFKHLERLKRSDIRQLERKERATKS